MPIQITIKNGMRDIPPFLDGVARRAVKRAVATSINRTFVGLRSEVTKTIRTERIVNTRTLPVSEIKDRYLKESKATSSAAALSSMFARLDFSDRRISMANFFVKRIATGKSKLTGKALYGVQATLFGKTRTLGKAFQPRAGTSPVYIRTGQSRLPIRKLWGPSIAILFDKLGLASRMAAYAKDRYQKEFKQNLAHFMGELRRKR